MNITQISKIIAVIGIVLAGYIFITQRSGLNKSSVTLAPPPPKKILIFSCNGGGGHQSVCNTIKHYLGSTYKIDDINALEILSMIDPVRTITFEKLSAEGFYNFLLKRNWIRTANLLGKFGRHMAVRSSSKMEKQFAAHIDNFKPDLVMSVMPFINGALYNVAKKKNLPFIVVTNDLDTSNYTVGIKSPTYDKFKFTLAFDNAEMKKKIAAAKIKQEQLSVVGFPIRPTFFESKSREPILNAFKLPADKPIILLMMGAAGSQVLYDYANELAKVDMPLHVVVCLGRNEELRKQLENSLPQSGQVTFTFQGFTDRISDLMAVSSALITKPGPNSICEAMQMNIPVLLDNTSPSLYWEQFNVDFVKMHGLGSIINQKKKMGDLLRQMLFNSALSSTIKKNILSLSKPCFPKLLGNLVKEMVENK